MNIKDGNGYTPDTDDSAPGPSLTGLAERFNVPDDPVARCHWLEGYLAALSVVAAHASERLEQVTRRAE